MEFNTKVSRNPVNKTKILIDNFIEKIVSINNSTKNLEEKISIVNDLLNNIIDYCIKKNIYFFINNDIKYNTICELFKEYLIIFIKNFFDNNNNKNILEYIENNVENYDNYSSINSLILHEYKKEQFENKKNNKVSFRDNISLVTSNNNEDNSDNSNNSENNNIKYNVTHIKMPDNLSTLSLNTKLGLYIMMLLDQNMIFENSKFLDKLMNLCEELQNFDNKNDFINFFR
jgi:hypothetical protein